MSLKPDDRDDGFLELIGLLTNVIGNERVRAYNEGLDAERERCARVLEDGAMIHSNPDSAHLLRCYAATIRAADEQGSKT